MKYVKSYIDFLFEADRDGETAAAAIKKGIGLGHYALRRFMPQRVSTAMYAINLTMSAIAEQLKYTKKLEAIKVLLEEETDPKKKTRLHKKIEKMTAKEVGYKKKVELAKDKMEIAKKQMTEEEQKQVRAELRKLRKETKKETKGWRKYIYPVWKLDDA